MHQHFCDDADLEYLIIDSTVVRAHPCAAGAPQKGWPGGPGPGPEPRWVQHQDSRERGRLGQLSEEQQARIQRMIDFELSESRRAKRQGRSKDADG